MAKTFSDKKYLAYADNIAHAFDYDKDSLEKLLELAIGMEKSWIELKDVPRSRKRRGDIQVWVRNKFLDPTQLTDNQQRNWGKWKTFPLYST